MKNEEKFEKIKEIKNHNEKDNFNNNEIFSRISLLSGESANKLLEILFNRIATFFIYNADQHAQRQMKNEKKTSCSIPKNLPEKIETKWLFNITQERLGSDIQQPLQAHFKFEKKALQEIKNNKSYDSVFEILKEIDIYTEKISPAFNIRTMRFCFDASTQLSVEFHKILKKSQDILVKQNEPFKNKKISLELHNLLSTTNDMINKICSNFVTTANLPNKMFEITKNLKAINFLSEEEFTTKRILIQLADDMAEKWIIDLKQKKLLIETPIEEKQKEKEDRKEKEIQEKQKIKNVTLEIENIEKEICIFAQKAKIFLSSMKDYNYFLECLMHNGKPLFKFYKEIVHNLQISQNSKTKKQMLALLSLINPNIKNFDEKKCTNSIQKLDAILRSLKNISNAPLTNKEDLLWLSSDTFQEKLLSGLNVICYTAALFSNKQNTNEIDKIWQPGLLYAPLVWYLVKQIKINVEQKLSTFNENKNLNSLLQCEEKEIKKKKKKNQNKNNKKKKKKKKEKTILIEKKEKNKESFNIKKEKPSNFNIAPVFSRIEGFNDAERAFFYSIKALEIDNQKSTLLHIKWGCMPYDQVSCIIKTADNNNQKPNEIDFEPKIATYLHENKLERYHQASIAIFKQYFNAAEIIPGSDMKKMI